MVDQLPAFQEKLELYKQELAAHQLLISEEAYVELKVKQNQSLKEFVQVKVYETLQSYLRDLDKQRYDNQEATSQLLQYKTQLERERMEKDNMAKQLKDLRLDSHRRIDALERRNQELEADNQVLNQQIKTADGAQVKQQGHLEKIRQLEIDKKHYEQQSKILEAQVNKIQEGKHEVERRSESLRREIDMLTQDKSFLSRERAQLQDQVKRLEDRLDRAEQGLLEAKK
jgi:chromosome segregation ATPase